MSTTTHVGLSNVNILHMEYDTGNVGMGCYDPNAKLDVAGAVRVRSNLEVQGKVNTQSQVMAHSIPSATTPAFAFVNNSNTGMYNAAPYTLGFSTDGAERMRIDSQGNIGIATTTPEAPLDVNGPTIVRSNIVIYGTLNICKIRP